MNKKDEEIILDTRRQEKYEMEPGGEKQPFKKVNGGNCALSHQSCDPMDCSLASSL